MGLSIVICCYMFIMCSSNFSPNFSYYKNSSLDLLKNKVLNVQLFKFLEDELEVLE